MTPEQIQELRELRAKVMADGERGGFNVGLQGMYQNRLSVAAPQLLSAAERCVVLEEAFGQDQPWSLLHVLEKLIETSDILLKDNDYTGHAWELHMAARNAAEEYVRKIRAALTPTNNTKDNGKG